MGRSRMRRPSRVRKAASWLASIALVASAPVLVEGTAAADTGHAPKTPIQHLVFLTQENHTFDNYFGTRPGVDGIPPNTCMPVNPGKPTPCIKPFHITDKGNTDPDHTGKDFNAQYDNGKMDGFVSMYTAEGEDGSGVMAYYDASDLPYYWNIADNYVLFDHFFSSARDGSPPNHMFEVTATNGFPIGSTDIPPGGWGNLPTIFDRLEAAGVSWKFYVENYNPAINFRTPAANDQAQLIWVPLLGYARYLDSPELMSHIVDLSQYYKDAAAGTLPAVAYIEPSGDSEHPPGRVQSGETLVRGLLSSLMRSTDWSSSAFLWTYDDWGGYYDHVKPPQVDKYGYGFRVPALAVGPYAKKDFVDSTQLDFTSVLKFIEYNWSVAPLSTRDAQANNILTAFDFNAPPRAPALIGADRGTTTTPRPRTSAIYLTFGATAGLVLLLTVIALLFGHRRRKVEEPALEPVGSSSGPVL